ncbi:geranylgeranyl diphosphate synthase [Patulibacter medicamentivorans]|uniref:Geranylgeranyl diphosphate synthase n=1 Tax=Patulibacter medicamentivorans TaxID=1097667 RepID=H0E4U5_9ACTN|nr:farnesyl diphosphate synthase [Patulibacter medicamentivorans]EHN11298.1 geranylgeranyl diphosphate synthase [Patulibacter medicamentivorans]
MSTSSPATAVPVYPDHLRDTIERYLEQLRFPARSAGVAGLEEAMRYSLLAGGKRIRPVLALATARAVGLEDRDVLPLAAAIELIHTYSLIHDDLPAMDDDDLRRGRPTCHVAYGEDVAILAGDALYAEAFHLLLRDGARAGGVPAERVLAAAAELADATGVDGMVGGQFLDVKGIGSSARAGEEGDAGERLRVLHGLKTGRLIGASVGGVVRLAGLDDERAEPYRRFAAELGVLFQIVDDILDVTGTEQDLGKPQGSDERHGKRTYVTEYGLQGAREMARRHHAAAASALDDADPSGAPDLRTLTAFFHTRTN